MARQSGDGFLSLKFTSDDWLRNHFLAKAPQRTKQIVDLPISAGDRILDVCCGPGHYAEQFAMMTGPLGHVYGVDKDPTHIEQAERRKAISIVRNLLTYDTHDVASGMIPTIIGRDQPDVVTIFNSLFYFDDQPSILKLYFDRLKLGGRLIIKDSDFGHFCVSPFDTSLQHRVIEAAERDATTSFDNFAGRRLFSLAQTIAGAKLSARIWPYVVHAPLSNELRRYVSMNLMTLLDQGRPRLKNSDAEKWSKLYDAARPEAHINSSSFFFTMNEIVVIAAKS